MVTRQNLGFGESAGFARSGMVSLPFAAFLGLSRSIWPVLRAILGTVASGEEERRRHW